MKIKISDILEIIIRDIILTLIIAIFVFFFYRQQLIIIELDSRLSIYNWAEIQRVEQLPKGLVGEGVVPSGNNSTISDPVVEN